MIKKGQKNTIVPPSFSKKWDEYKKKWENMVTDGARFEDERISKELYKIWLIDFEEQLSVDGKIPEEVYKEKGKTPEELYKFAWEYLDEDGLDHEERLDYLKDNPAIIMDELYSYLNELVGNDYFDGLINYKHLEAWDYFEDTLGIDYSKIYNRWHSAPELLISSHLLNSNITPIEELYHEAVRAYIFGLTEASVAMCRALMEHILRKYYRGIGNNIADIISSAESQHNYLKDLKLHSKRKLVNKVIHDYGNHAKDIEKAAFDFIQTIRHLVTGIPST